MKQYLRETHIPCRVHGFTIEKNCKKVLWRVLFILDKEYLSQLQSIYSACLGSFCGYGIAVKDFCNPIIDFDWNNTYIQSEGINRDFGVYDCPDDLLKEHHQEMSVLKAFFIGI